jgi:hypothetical protein
MLIASIYPVNRATHLGFSESMEVEEALVVADALVFAKTGKHLSTLQTAIFCGTWLGQKYEQIAQACYCSDGHIRAVGAALWELLSEGLEEKVSKKTFRAALERRRSFCTSDIAGTPLVEVQSPQVQEEGEVANANPTEVGEAVSARVVVCNGSQDPDIDLAREFEQALKAAGHKIFMAGESIRLEENWSQRLNAELKCCDYFLLLLSSQAAVSEMVTEFVRSAKTLRDSHPNHKPAIVPIRVDAQKLPLNYDLRGYLNQIQQHQWRSPVDMPMILQEILSSVVEGQVPVDELTVAVPTTPSTLASPDSPPLPVAEPELPEGQVDLASAFYIERPPVESRCYETILKPGALIRIKAPRQMGKTTLMARILHQAALQGYRTVPLSFQLADGRIFQDLDKFLRWFCVNVGLGLQLPNQLADYWDEIFGSKISCKAYFERYLLTQIAYPLVLGLDEVDRIFQYPELADDFFGLLRAWHEEAKNRDVWKKLRLVVVHSTEVYIPLNINQSPFNVGLPIELPEFTSKQVQDLAWRHGLNWDVAKVEQLMAMVGGHPYLVRVALYHIARQDMTLEQFLQIAPTEAGPLSDHLRRHLWNLQQQPDLAFALKTVVTATRPVRLEVLQAFKLYSMGLVHLQGNEVTPRCDLYRQYFRDPLAST